MDHEIQKRRARDRERTAKYRSENPEKIKEIQKRSYDRLKNDPDRIEKLREWQKRYRENNRKALSDSARKRRFGITSEKYAELFKSQNGTTWEPSQWEDLKYQLWRAEFVRSGFVNFYNPKLTNQTLNYSKKLF